MVHGRVQTVNWPAPALLVRLLARRCGVVTTLYVRSRMAYQAATVKKDSYWLMTHVSRVSKTCSRIDSCNALLFGIPEKDLSKLQTVQNCAARLVEHAKRRDPVTPMLTRLHWLPVDKRIVYKIVLLCHIVLIHKSPTYLASVLTPYLPQRNLCSSSKQLLVVLTSSTCTYGDRAFASAAPILWNKLPDKLKTETDTSSFMKSLKTYRFLM